MPSARTRLIANVRSCCRPPLGPWWLWEARLPYASRLLPAPRMTPHHATIGLGALQCNYGARTCSTTVAASATLSDGTVLEGDILRDDAGRAVRLRSGRVTLPDGRTFSGQFDAITGVPEAHRCTLTEDGDAYDGEFSSAWQRHGTGRATLADGTTYEGRFEADDFVEGKVVIPSRRSAASMSSIADAAVFVGRLKDEQFVTGRLRQRAFTYEGAFDNNVPHGKGRLEYSNGAVHEGTFFRGKLHGNDCKMRLANGFVYLGTFADGVIRNGELRSPTFTYEGDFDDNGMAHGKGRAEQLAIDPKLIFLGDWIGGRFVSGAVHDEDGSPVDFKNSPDLESQLFTKEQVVRDRYMESKMREGVARLREKELAFDEDATIRQRETGVRPDQVGLGYDGGPSSSAEAYERIANQEIANDSALGEGSDKLQGLMTRASATATTFQAEHHATDPSVVAAIRREALADELHQEQIRRRAREQLERFEAGMDLRAPVVEEDGPAPAACGGPSGGAAASGDHSGEHERRQKLRIDGNPAWSSYVARPR